jgi:hypothetical protein
MMSKKSKAAAARAESSSASSAKLSLVTSSGAAAPAASTDDASLDPKSGVTFAKPAYIVGPFFDCVAFIYAPAIALLLAAALTRWEWGTTEQAFGPEFESPIDFFIGSFIFAHLALVFFRTHLNREIFSRYKYRFTVAPAALALGLYLSPTLLVFVGVLATWWDVYHSGLQTWGLARIYDQRAGNPPTQGRWLDYGLNIFIYAGPILAGASLMGHLEDFKEFDRIGWPELSALANDNGYATTLAPYVIAAGVAYLAYYLWSYRKLVREGYKIPETKVHLLAMTAFVSILVWGTNTFGMAFWIMNFFHAWQYFAIVWWAEDKTVAKTFGLPTKSRSIATLAVMLALSFGFGIWAELQPGNYTWVVLTVSIMHFWWDGFIWSVRRKQVS